MCLYFEVNQTNIPANTIALIADPGNYTNNLYAYTDAATGKTILSATTVQHKEKSIGKIIEKVIIEVQQYTGASLVTYIHHYKINFALPDITDLKMTAQPSKSQAMENVFVAGDYLFNGSLNAAMESGRLAAQGMIQKKQADAST